MTGRSHTTARDRLSRTRRRFDAYQPVRGGGALTPSVKPARSGTLLHFAGLGIDRVCATVDQHQPGPDRLARHGEHRRHVGTESGYRGHGISSQISCESGVCRQTAVAGHLASPIAHKVRDQPSLAEPVDTFHWEHAGLRSAAPGAREVCDVSDTLVPRRTTMASDGCRASWSHSHRRRCPSRSHNR